MPTAPACAHHTHLCPSRRFSTSSLYRGLHWVSERAGELHRAHSRGEGRGLRAQAPGARTLHPHTGARVPFAMTSSTGHLPAPEVVVAPRERANGSSSVLGRAARIGGRVRLPALQGPAQGRADSGIDVPCSGPSTLRELPVAAGWAGAGPPQKRRFGQSPWRSSVCGDNHLTFR